jgi:AcrR family transcriptional regulator
VTPVAIRHGIEPTDGAHYTGVVSSTPAEQYLVRRREQGAVSREKILDAAVACLIEDGYTHATTLRIQARAGVSRGKLLHHFASREQLLVAAAQHLAKHRVADIEARAAAIAAEHPDGWPRLECMVELLWSTFHEPLWWAAAELWTAARTDDAIAAALLPEERRLGPVVREIVDMMFGPRYVAHARYPQLCEQLLSSMRGAAMTYSFDRRNPASDPHVTAWKDLVRLMIAV